MASTRPALFKGRHFQDRLIVLCLRGLEVGHSTIGRWVLQYAPELYQRVRREPRFPNRSWRVDETMIKVHG